MLLLASWLASGGLARSTVDIESLRALVEAQGVSGQEEPVRQELQRRLPAGVHPEVDDLVSLGMDLWAQEEGYARVAPGLAGI